MLTNSLMVHRNYFCTTILQCFFSVSVSAATVNIDGLNSTNLIFACTGRVHNFDPSPMFYLACGRH